MKTTQENINWLASAVLNNGIDWYACLLADGGCEVGLGSAHYSSITQCGHDPKKYGIAAMIQCNPDLNDAEAMDYVESELETTE